MEALLFIATCFLAYSNGANDNFKGVASLYGSGTVSYRVAILWATVATLAGSFAAVVLAESLLRSFSGRGVVLDEVAGSQAFLLSVAAGAGLTVIAATRLGFPISTTHALTGAILGTGMMASESVNIPALGSGFILPLLLSPVLAVFLATVVYTGLRSARTTLGIHKESCICVAPDMEDALPSGTGVMALQREVPSVSLLVEDQQVCDQLHGGHLLGFRAQSVIDAVHFLSAGVVSFARGLNDTPKIAAALLVIRGLDVPLSVGAIAVAMALGGILSARRVADTMSTKITTMSHGQGLASNLTTGALVLLASVFGLPVSTTHVSVGALAGIGWMNGGANAGVLRGIGLSWLLTLPFATLCSAVVWWLLRFLNG